MTMRIHPWFLALALAVGCQADCTCAPPKHDTSPVFPAEYCRADDTCNWNVDGSATRVCLLWESSYGYCTEPCTAWTSSELADRLSSSDRVCLGWSGSGIDPSLAGTAEGLWFYRVLPGDPFYANVRISEVGYGITTVTIYRP